MTAAKKVYTEQQVHEYVLEAFQTGRKVERRVAGASGQSDLDRAYAKGFVHGAEVAQDPNRYRAELDALNAAVVAKPQPTDGGRLPDRTRGHLTLIQGG